MDFLRRLLGGEQSSHQPPQVRPIEQRPASMRDGMQVQLYEAKRTWRSWASQLSRQPLAAGRRPELNR
jgi:hypothetical protein